MTQVLDTNVLVRHFTGTPADQASAATAFLKAAAPGQLRLSDVHVSEFVWVLESSIYQADRATISAALDAVIALPAIEVGDEALLQKAIDLYAQRGMDWTDAYLVATAIRSQARDVVSFDRFDSKLGGLGLRRVEPGRNSRQ
ncbi:MAG TPA: PIN domain-containing protein [Candidatus Micrarchaeaceae archaeon]|nr:PIN domain-containing protein [Candidatus Micrarchaeaceae archaeon]